MRIIDPQNATLTTIEVLSHITSNPPRRPPTAPPATNNTTNSRNNNWAPSPDLRDHNTVVKEIHNHVTRLAPHLLRYPRYDIDIDTLQAGEEGGQGQLQGQGEGQGQVKGQTPLDVALRDLIRGLQPFGLTKGEVLMIVNLGVGAQQPPSDQDPEEEAQEEQEPLQNGGGEGETEGQMDVDVDVDADAGEVNGDAGEGEGEGAGEAGEAEGGEGDGEDDYGALALLDTVIEEREERLSSEDVAQILRVIRETLGSRED